MTDLVRYQEQTSSLELAPQAWKLAEKIAATDFVPSALRNRPEAVLACILAGHEAGVPPMQALAKIHIIEGRPAMAAELMRAIVLRAGHELDYENVSTTSVTAAGRRRGKDRWTRVTWTMDDAKRGGLDQKQNWRKWPRAMLIARATAELCRLVFPDVLAGISYTVEELSDGNTTAADVVDFGPPELAEPVVAEQLAPARQTARSPRGAITRAAAPADVIEHVDPLRGEVPMLPGDDDIADAELVVEASTAPAAAEHHPEPVVAEADRDEWQLGEWDSGDFPSEHNPETGKKYTGPQLIAMRLGARFGITGNGAGARAQRLEAIRQLLKLDTAPTSSKDLTPAQIQTVIRVLDELPEGATLDLSPPATGGDSAETPPPTEPATPVTEPEPVYPPETSPPAPADPTPPPRPRPAPQQPEDWTAGAWRDLLGNRGVKVTEAIREAQRLAREIDPKPSIATLDDIAGSGLAADLLGYVEDLGLERRAK